MWDTVLDHNNGYQQNLASSTYLVFKIEGALTQGILKNDTMHAEKKLISIIQETCTAPLNFIIYIYINNSPCAECATSLKKFMVDNQNIKMVLYIAHLYNIKRRSCALREIFKKRIATYTSYSKSNPRRYLPWTEESDEYWRTPMHDRSF